MSRILPTTTSEDAEPAIGHSAALPDIDTFKSADIVIYDGNCNFCRKQVKRLNWFANGALAFLSLHDPRTSALCPDLTYEQLMEQMFVVTTDGQRYAGAAAIRYLSRKLPRLWFAAPFLHIPYSLPLWQHAYRQIANARYGISGSQEDCDDGACRVHAK